MPGKAVNFLSVDEVLAIHERLIERFGGQSGLRDRGLLESALYRAQTGYYETLEEMATAQFESLLINHPFVVGKKRVALGAAFKSPPHTPIAAITTAHARNRTTEFATTSSISEGSIHPQTGAQHNGKTLLA